MGQLVCRTPSPRGLRRPFDRRVPGAPFCGGDDQRSRPDRWPHPSLDSAARKALRRSSRAAPRCLESASTTDVSRHEHPRQTSPLETARRNTVGNPPTFRHRDRPRGKAAFPPFRPRTAPDHLAVIRPPTAPCLTARRRLRADRLPAFALARSGWGEERRSFLGCRRLRRFEPSDTSPERPARGRVSALEPIA
jgi:hypothetical protein